MTSLISLTLTPSQNSWLNAQAKARGTTPTAVLLGLLERERKSAPPAVEAPADLFTAPTNAPAPLQHSAVPPRPAAPRTGSGSWHLWSDGACSGNPGPGGWGTIAESPDGERHEFSGGWRVTTNNRMELMGAISGLEAVPRGAHVLLTTDSRYIVDALEKKWLAGWKRKGWRKADGGAVANVDLWQRLETAMSGKFLKLEWVKGHNGHPQNERCDHLAVTASHRSDLPDDPA